MDFRSVTFRLTLFFSTVSTAVLLSVGYLVGSLVESHFIEQDLNALDGTTELVRNVLAKVRFQSDLDLVPQLLDDALVGYPGLSIKIVGPEGRTLFASSDAVFPDAPIDGRSVKPVSGKSEPVVWESGGHAYREIAAALPLGIAGVPPATVDLDGALALLEKAEVPSGRIYSIADIAADLHYQARGMIERHKLGDDDLLLPGIVPKLSATPGGTKWIGPRLGEHTDEVLRSLGYDDARLASLRASGVVS